MLLLLLLIKINCGQVILLSYPTSKIELGRPNVAVMQSAFPLTFFSSEKVSKECKLEVNLNYMVHLKPT